MTSHAEPLLAKGAAQGTKASAELPPVMFHDTLTDRGYVPLGQLASNAPEQDHARSSLGRLYYELHGQGPIKVVFICGFATHLVAWECQVKYFARQPDYQVCLFDNRGCGWSEEGSSFYRGLARATTKHMAEDLVELLHYLQWLTTENKEEGDGNTNDATQIHVVGSSMGGMILQELLLNPRTQGRLASATLLSTCPGGWPYSLRTMVNFVRLGLTKDFELRAQRFSDIFFPTEWLHRNCSVPSGDATISSSDEAMEDSSSKSLLTNRRWVRDTLHARLSFTRPQPFYGFICHALAILRHSVKASRLQHLRAQSTLRTLVMVGTDDEVIPPQESLTLASRANAPLLVFTGAGHILAMEQADRVNSVLERHFNGQLELGF
ncbi:hypothetical protein IWQ62_003088 [Dispira parvispora]|uniref:AB hydrolase-1 domain-containing protein n=1 Tax=Dispira parvispora TaxID=1520584 RepID=A0A9W8ARI4_9FUNG|nr:hypothetical protein IWQ62_003088 [Dispira parvispora]